MRIKIKSKWQRKQEHFAKKKGKEQRRVKKKGKTRIEAPPELKKQKHTIVDDYFNKLIDRL